VKIDYADKDIALGFAVLDSVYSPKYLKGDGELKHNAGFEAYITSMGLGDLKLWGGLAYDSKGGFQSHSVLAADFWGQYQIDKATAFAAEYAYKDGGPGAKGYNWLALLTYAFDAKTSAAFRLSGEKMSDGGPSFTKFTIAPGYAVTDKLTVRAEYSYYDYSSHTVDSASFYGIQAYFKF
jgi:opacity protein-like surface antigen